jgi:hypothetical protein
MQHCVERIQELTEWSKGVNDWTEVGNMVECCDPCPVFLLHEIRGQDGRAARLSRAAMEEDLPPLGDLLVGELKYCWEDGQ